MEDKKIAQIFDNVKFLYDDMTSCNQSFIKSEDESIRNKPIIEGSTVYRLVKYKKGHLEFHSNKFGGSNLKILGNILHAEKVDNSDADSLSEYRLTIEGREEPLILLACKKRKVS